MPAEEPSKPGLRPWREYRAIMWVGDSAFKDPARIPLFHQRLRDMGINTSMVHGEADSGPALSNAFPFYIENMVNRGLCLKWNSKVADWEKFVTDWARQGRPESALVRDYCLDDPEWNQWARAQMRKLVNRHRRHKPIAYDLRDELSTTISANPFDYDFAPQSLAQFREWLKTIYPSLDALNAQWDTRFGSWDEVKPFTTDAIKNRMAGGEAVPRGNPDWQALQGIRFDPAAARREPARWNFSPWADFRTYMDLALARALDGLRQTAHELDPETPVGVEGTQMPHAFGGYDLWRLSQALDWVEPYDIGNAREIFGSFMAEKTILTTVFENDTPHASRRLWHLLLEGDHGCIIWWSEDSIDWKDPQYSLTPKARALAPVLHEMTSPLARLFMLAKRERDPIFIHYSQPSLQVDWLIESTVDGSTWLRRFSSFEADYNQMAKARNSWLKLFQDLGYSPRFISSAQLTAGSLTNGGHAVLVLPTSWALSAAEADAIARLQSPPAARAGGTLLFNGTPGEFDEHGKLRPVNPLARHFASLRGIVAVNANQPVTSPPQDIEKYGAERLKPNSSLELALWARTNLGSLSPEVSVPLSARARVHRFSVGPQRLFAFERNIDYHMSEELKQAGGNEPLEVPVEVSAKLKTAKHLYDLQRGVYLGFTDEIRFTLDPWKPSLFAATEGRLAETSLVSALTAQLPGASTP